MDDDDFGMDDGNAPGDSGGHGNDEPFNRPGLLPYLEQDLA